MFLKNGEKYIQAKIGASKGEKVVITGNYEVENTIFLPSGTHLVLENCHLKMADNTFCNMFANKGAKFSGSRTLDDCDKNIIVEGCGKAILDGGNYNGLSERNSLKDGNPHISVNNLMLFANVDGFEIKNLHCRNQRWWALNFIACRNGKLRDIDFLADYRKALPDGTLEPYLTLENHQVADHIKNADGIDIRKGCHDIIIENVTGFTEDDTVALTCLNGGLEKMYGALDAEKSIYNIIVRNVMSTAYCANVRLLNQGGTKLYNILVDGVFDTSRGSKYAEGGIYGVRVGDNYMYGDTHSTADETFNITIKNVNSRASQAALQLVGEMKNVHYYDISGFDCCKTVVDNQATIID